MTSDLNTGYSTKDIAFIRWPLHAEEYLTAHYALDHRTSRVLLERLHRERRTLPKGHICTCRCLYQRPGWPPCIACRALKANEVQDDTPVEIGRSSSKGEPPMPSALMLDLERAISVLGASTSAYEVSRWLGGQENAA